MGEGRNEILRRHVEDAETALREAQAAVSMENARQMEWITRTGVLMSVLPSTANGT